MALINCPDCEKMISSRAQMCPFCGCPSEFWSKEAENTINEDSAFLVDDDSTEGTEDMSEDGVLAVEDDTSSLEEHDLSQCSSTEVGVVVEPNGAVFGLQSEQMPNQNKYPFTVIVDPQRETDMHVKGKTHVLFRLGNSKYLMVSKDDLFYAPIEQEIDDERVAAKERFKQYLDGVTGLRGMTTGAESKANGIIGEYCQYLVKKLIQFGIYEYDLNNFASLCGSQILITETGSYKSVMSQERNVDEYARNLSRQRDIERASRSQWQGGGFGVKGAIKGAVTAGAMNAVTGAFRSVGDGFTDAGDRSDIQSKYDDIVNDKNKRALCDSFSRECLFRAQVIFYRILSQKTGWNASGVLQLNWDEAEAKLKNIEYIEDKNIREQILIELLSRYPYNYDVLEYAMSHCIEYDFELSDLIHFVKRISPDSFDSWMIDHFTDTLRQIEKHKTGEERKCAIISMGITFGIIDENLNVINRRNLKFSADLIMCLIETEMSEYGFSLKEMEEQTQDIEKAEIYFNKLLEIGKKYKIFDANEVGNEFKLVGLFVHEEAFYHLESLATIQLIDLCCVRDHLCKNLQEAKLLTSEWNEFDEIYIPFDSYADYDSKLMQQVIDRIRERNFTSEHLQGLVSGEGGLESKKNKLEERERSEVFKKSQQVIKQMTPYVGEGLFVYGSEGFLEKAKNIRKFDKVKEKEKDVFPLVIFDASDSAGFKGFVVTDNYFYNYNSVWGIGFGDKVLSLYDIRETSKNGKNRLFKLANGKTEKIKIIQHEDLIIGTLSEVFSWNTDANKVLENPTNSMPEASSVPGITEVDNGSMKNCPICGKQIAAEAKFCTFCGNRIGKDEAVDAKVPCSNCGKMIKAGAKFCTFCGVTTP